MIPLEPEPNPLLLSWYTMVITRVLYLFAFGTVGAVKIAYLCFFRKLLGKVRLLECWWWFCIAVIAPASIIGMFMVFYVCPATNFDDYLSRPFSLPSPLTPSKRSLFD